MAEQEDGFVEKAEGQVLPEQVADLSEAIGEEGTLASIRARIPKIRRNPATDVDEEIPVEEVATSEVKEEKVAAGDDKGKGKEKPAGPRFKNRAEAEKAHAEAERKMHEATTESAKKDEVLAAKDAALALAKQEAADLKEKLDAALAAKPPEKEKEPEKKGETEEELDAKFEAIADAANEEAITAIAALEDPDTWDQEAVKAHNKKVAAIWTKANTKIIKAAKQTSVSPESVAKIVADQLEAKEAAAKAAKAEDDKKTAAEKAVEEDARTWASAFEMAGKSGLDVAEGSAERDLFEIIAKRDLAKQEFMKGETPPPLKEQVEWVVKQVNTRLGKKIDQTDERRRKAREHQERNQPLIRGGNTKPPGEETLSEPVSLASIRQKDIETRRVRQRGV